MTPPVEDSLDLGPEEVRVGEHLRDQRPVPAAGFRGALGRQLVARDPGYGPRPPRLWTIVAAYAAAALILLVIGVLVADQLIF